MIEEIGLLNWYEMHKGHSRRREEIESAGGRSILVVLRCIDCCLYHIIDEVKEVVSNESKGR